MSFPKGFNYPDDPVEFYNKTAALVDRVKASDPTSDPDRALRLECGDRLLHELAQNVTEIQRLVTHTSFSSSSSSSQSNSPPRHFSPLASPQTVSLVQEPPTLLSLKKAYNAIMKVLTAEIALETDELNRLLRKDFVQSAKTASQIQAIETLRQKLQDYEDVAYNYAVNLLSPSHPNISKSDVASLLRNTLNAIDSCFQTLNEEARKLHQALNQDNADFITKRVKTQLARESFYSILNNTIFAEEASAQPSVSITVQPPGAQTASAATASSQSTAWVPPPVGAIFATTTNLQTFTPVKSPVVPNQDTAAIAQVTHKLGRLIISDSPPQPPYRTFMMPYGNRGVEVLHALNNTDTEMPDDSPPLLDQRKIRQVSKHNTRTASESSYLGLPSSSKTPPSASPHSSSSLLPSSSPSSANAAKGSVFTYSNSSTPERASPLPSSSPSLSPQPGSRKKKRRSIAVGKSINHEAGKIYAAFQRLDMPTWPIFNDIRLLVGIESDWKLDPRQRNHILKFRNKLPQKHDQAWRDYTANLMQWTKSLPVDKAKTLESVDGRSFTFYPYEKPLAVHFTSVKNSGYVLEVLAEEANGGIKALDNPKFIMNTMDKLCVSVMQSVENDINGGKTCSYYSAQDERQPGIGFAVAIDPQTVVHTYGKDSLSPTFFKAVGAVTSILQKDSEEKVIFYNNFWIRYSVVGTYVEAIYENSQDLVHPVNRKIAKIRQAMEQVPYPSILRAFSIIKTSELSRDTIAAVFSTIKEAVNTATSHSYSGAVIEEITEQVKGTTGERIKQAVGLAPTISNEERAHKMASALANAPRDKKYENAFIAAVKSTCTDSDWDQADETLDSAVEHAVKSLSAIAAPMPTPHYLETLLPDTTYAHASLISEYVGEPDLFLQLNQTMANISALELGEQSNHEKWVFEQIFRREPTPQEDMIPDLTSIHAFTTELCENNLAKLRKDNDKTPDMRIFGQSNKSPELLVAETEPNSYNEANTLTHRTAKELGFTPPTFAALALEDYVLTQEGKIPNEIAERLQEAEAAGLPLIMLRTPVRK